MLDFLRKRKRNWIVVFLLGAIIVVFIAFYGGNKFQDSGGGNVAEVNGEPITQREFAEQYQRTVDRYRDMLKGSLTPEMLKSLNIKGTLLEQMVQKKLVLQEARRLGLTASDEELAGVLERVPDFQVAGRFNKERYLQLLRANRLAPESFEEEQRDQVSMQRLYGMLLDSVRVNDAELRDRYRSEREKLNVNFIKVPANDYIADVKASDDDIKKYYERNKEAFKEPLKVQVEYLVYPFEQFINAAQVSTKEIEDYYQANRDAKFHTPKQAKVRTLLITFPAGGDAKQKDEARARAQRVLADIRAGKDFAQLAMKEPQGPNASKGGDLGWVSQGQFPPEIEKVVFSLAKGGVSDLTEVAAGFQIFKVEDIKPEKTQTLAEATAEITRTLKTEKGKKEAAAVAERDRQKAVGGADFAKIAQESNLVANTTRFFASGEVLPEFGGNQDIYKAALSLNGKDVSPVLEGPNAYLLLRNKQRKEPSIPPLEAVRPTIEKRLIESKAYEIAQQKANAALEELKKDKDIAKVAEKNKLKVEETGFFQRNSPQVPKLGETPELKTAATAVSSQKPIAEKVFTQKDSVYIFAFKAMEPADMEQFAKEKDALEKQALGETRQRVMQKFIEGLKEKGKVKLHPDALGEE